MSLIRRGQIYFADIDPVVGREQKGIRPVLVVSADSINSRPLVVTVALGTSSGRIKQDFEFNFRVPAG